MINRSVVLVYLLIAAGLLPGGLGSFGRAEKSDAKPYDLVITNG